MQLMNEFMDPSPVHSRSSFTTSPTRGEVILTDAKNSPTRGEVILTDAKNSPTRGEVILTDEKPSPLVGEGAPQGRVRGIKHYQLTRYFRLLDDEGSI